MDKTTATRDLFDLRGRTAVVTGGGGALAGEIARALGELGVKVAVLDIRAESAEETAHAITEAGGNAVAVQCDVLDTASIESACRTSIEALGPPSFLLNGAGGNVPSGSTEAEYYGDGTSAKTFFDLSYDGMRAAFDLNYFGTVLPCSVFGRVMAEQGSGAIVNIASITAHNPLTKVGQYGAAKAAVVSFTRWLATHLSQVNVRVNAIAPGFILAEQLRFLHFDEHGEYTTRARNVIEHTPMRRYGEPSELIGAVVWLFSDASSFASGSVVTIDGGFSTFTV